MPSDQSRNSGSQRIKDNAEIDRLEMALVRSKARLQLALDSVKGIPCSSVIDSTIKTLTEFTEVLNQIRTGQASGRFPNSRKAEYHPPSAPWRHLQG